MRTINIILLVVPFLVGFAPVPPVRHIDDPDQAILKFNRQVCGRNYSGNELVQCRRHLIGRLEGLQDRLLKDKSDKASIVHDLVVLVQSLDANNKLGKDNPSSLVQRASCGKYQHLLHVICAPGDRAVYGDQKDFGFWNGHTYATQENLKPGHWVYDYPRWFIWRDTSVKNGD